MKFRRAERGCALPHTARDASPSPNQLPRPIPAPYHVGSCVSRCHLAGSKLVSSTLSTLLHALYPPPPRPIHTLPTRQAPPHAHPITPLLWRGSGAGPSSLARRCSCCSSAACCPEPAHYRPRRPRQRRPAHRHLCRRSHPRPRIARSLAGGLVTAPRLEGSGIPTSCTRRVLTTQPITCSAYMCSMHA